MSFRLKKRKMEDITKELFETIKKEINDFNSYIESLDKNINYQQRFR